MVVEEDNRPKHTKGQPSKTVEIDQPPYRMEDRRTPNRMKDRPREWWPPLNENGGDVSARGTFPSLSTLVGVAGSRSTVQLKVNLSTQGRVLVSTLDVGKSSS